MASLPKLSEVNRNIPQEIKSGLGDWKLKVPKEIRSTIIDNKQFG